MPLLLQIERIQNPELHTQYEAKKAQMLKQNKGIELEKILWHGTSSDVIQNINREGFNRSFCGKNCKYYQHKIKKTDDVDDNRNKHLPFL